MSAAHRYALPWDHGSAQEQWFRQLTLRTIAALAALSVLISVLPLPQTDPHLAPAVPPRLARLVLEKPVPPPPPPVVEQRAPEVEPEPVRPEPVRPREPVARSEPTVAPEPDPQPEVDRSRQAREEAEAALTPMADELAALRDNTVAGSVAGAQARIGAAGEARRTERALLTRDAATASGGVDTSTLSRDTGGSGLARRETTRVASTVAGLRGDEAADPRSSDGMPARSREEIEMVFDQNKGAIYALYQRALRSNPGLQGKVVLRLTIEPSGEVSSVEIVSSELGDDELESRLIQRVRMFRFDDKDVAPVTTTKPIDFFPA